MATPLILLRSLLASKKINYVIITSEDSHLNEYISPKDARRAYISGFDGSAGLAIVSTIPGENYLWTDQRYWIQAERQLDETEWHLMRQGKGDVPSPYQKLCTMASAGDVVAIDPCTISVDSMNSLKASCTGHQIELLLTQENLVDQVWPERKDLCNLDHSPICFMPLEISGMDVDEKLQLVHQQMRNSCADVLILTALDEIAWFLNLRGADIPYNPVFFSFLVIRMGENSGKHSDVTLFVDSTKLVDKVISDQLKRHEIQWMEYDGFYSFLNQISQAAAASSSTVWVDGKKCNYSIYHTIEQNGVHMLLQNSPVSLMKAVKNSVEVQGMRESHMEDGAALVEFFCWLSGNLESPNYHNELNEYSVSVKELEFRQVRKGFVGPSFTTISGVGANAAVIHYTSKSEEDSLELTRDAIYLNDSGGQYLNGTTDVTRTWHFGTPSEWQMKCYTCVLKGFISLSRAKFPAGISGCALDVLTREALWKYGLDYPHGTGHGVGHYLNVHEAPPGISIWKNTTQGLQPLEENMCTSIEPGYYEKGAFGIRIENVVVVREANISPNLNGQKFLEFEQLTMAPINKKLIIKSMLNADEIDYLNEYHDMVWKKISPRVTPEARKWLREATLDI